MGQPTLQKLLFYRSLAPTIKSLRLCNRERDHLGKRGMRGFMTRLLGIPTPQLRHLTYSLKGDEACMVRGLAKLSQLRSLEIHLSWKAWGQCAVADLQCMAGMHNLEVGTLPYLQFHAHTGAEGKGTEGDIWQLWQKEGRVESGV